MVLMGNLSMGKVQLPKIAKLLEIGQSRFMRVINRVLIMAIMMQIKAHARVLEKGI